MEIKKVSRDFYNRNTLVIAEEILGKTLVHVTKEGVTKGKIKRHIPIKGCVLEGQRFSMEKVVMRMFILYMECIFV